MHSPGGPMVTSASPGDQYSMIGSLILSSPFLLYLKIGMEIIVVES